MGQNKLVDEKSYDKNYNKYFLTKENILTKNYSDKESYWEKKSFLTNKSFHDVSVELCQKLNCAKTVIVT